MIIIVEGVDGQGKSYLCKRLKHDFNAELIHVGAPKTNNAFTEYIKMIVNLDLTKNYVFDRCFHGERVYGPIYRDKSTVDDTQQTYLELLVQRHVVKCIYCWTDVRNTKHVFKTRGEFHTKLKDVGKLHSNFMNIIKKSRLGWFRYDWRRDSYADMVEQFWLTRNNPSLTGDHLEWIGSTKPAILLIGDKKNPKLLNSPVFCSLSGMFLMRSLPHGILAITNSDDFLKEKIELLKPKKIIALGLSAAKRLKLLNINFKAVVHPQYAKRFYGKNAIKQYSNELKEAIK